MSVGVWSFPYRFALMSATSLMIPTVSRAVAQSSPEDLFAGSSFPAFNFPAVTVLKVSSSSSMSTSSKGYFTASSDVSPDPVQFTTRVKVNSPVPEL